jgi:hypothetical protein
MDNNNQSLGEKRIRVTFNPSNSDVITRIKTTFAELINECEEMKANGKNPRECAEAQTRIEDAAMWMVKAATS